MIFKYQQPKYTIHLLKMTKLIKETGIYEIIGLNLPVYNMLNYAKRILIHIINYMSNGIKVKHMKLLKYFIK